VSDGGRSDRPGAREVAVNSTIANLVALAVQLAVVLVIVKRDWVGQQVARYRRNLRQESRRAFEERQVAELRRDISLYDHAGGE
jgi:hypothetical protein